MSGFEGKIICIEGTDSVGKQTQCELLKNFINTYYNDCVIFSFPRYYTPTGQQIKKQLMKKSYNLLDRIELFADDRLAAREEIMNEINQGKTIIFDRYITSMMVYSKAILSCKNNDLTEDPYPETKSSSSLETLKNEIEKIIYQKEIEINRMPVCDVMFCLTVPPFISNQLIKNRKDIDENEKNSQLQKSCYQIYKSLCISDSPYSVSKKTIEIDCLENGCIKSIDKIQSSIILTLNKMFNINYYE